MRLVILMIKCGVHIVLQVTVGRLGGNTVAVNDNEVSGKHVAIRWDSSCRCWQVLIYIHASHVCYLDTHVRASMIGINV